MEALCVDEVRNNTNPGYKKKIADRKTFCARMNASLSLVASACALAEYSLLLMSAFFNFVFKPGGFVFETTHFHEHLHTSNENSKRDVQTNPQGSVAPLTFNSQANPQDSDHICC
jgi:hypothetical protein